MKLTDLTESNLTNVTVTYQSNYNGCYLTTTINGVEQYELNGFEEVSSEICEHAHQFCDEDGYFQGSVVDLQQFCTDLVKQKFGQNVVVEFVEDSSST